MRQLRIAGLMILSWALLVGCVTQRTTTNIKGDGSGTNDLRIGFSRQFLALAGMNGGSGGSNQADALFDQLDGLAEDLPAEWNARSEPWESEDKEFRGTRLLMDFKDLEMLSQQFSPEQLGSNPLAGVFQEFEARRDGASFVIHAKIDMSGAGEELGAEAEQMQSLLDSGMLGDSKPELVWRIELPGEITEWSERESAVHEGNAVTYTFPLTGGQSYVIDIRGKSAVGLPSPLVLVVGG
ncbi:MAG TPA: hypothetical protein VGE07_24155, partial [Herpetosiphonaceae bacterium]